MSTTECVWTYDDRYDVYDTSCDQSFQLVADTPSLNGFKFCAYCGQPLREAHPMPEPIEDEA
jgi:hypothetical protein